MIRNLRCTVTIDSVLTNSQTQNAFLFTVNAIFLHNYPLAVELVSTPRPLVQKKTWRDSLPIDMLLSAVSVLVVAQSSSEILEGLINNPVYLFLVFLIYNTNYFPTKIKCLCLKLNKAWFYVRSPAWNAHSNLVTGIDIFLW